MQSRDLDEVLDGFTLKGGGDAGRHSTPTSGGLQLDHDGLKRVPQTPRQGGDEEIALPGDTPPRAHVREKPAQPPPLDPAAATKFESLFTSLVGRRPTERELDDTLYLARTLRLADGDPLWPILLTYVHYDARMGEHHLAMTKSIESAQSLLSAISNEAASVRSDVCLIPQKIRHRFPLWMQIALSVKAIWAAMTLMAFMLSAISLMKVLEHNGGATAPNKTEISCYQGKGIFVQDKSGMLYCFPGKDAIKQ